MGERGIEEHRKRRVENGGDKEQEQVETLEAKMRQMSWGDIMENMMVMGTPGRGKTTR